MLSRFSHHVVLPFLSALSLFPFPLKSGVVDSFPSVLARVRFFRYTALLYSLSLSPSPSLSLYLSLCIVVSSFSFSFLMLLILPALLLLLFEMQRKRKSQESGEHWRTELPPLAFVSLFFPLHTFSPSFNFPLSADSSSIATHTQQKFVSL